jgi:hypothetical protein
MTQSMWSKHAGEVAISTVWRNLYVVVHEECIVPVPFWTPSSREVQATEMCQTKENGMYAYNQDLKSEHTILDMATIRQPTTDRYLRDLKPGTAQEAILHLGEIRRRSRHAGQLRAGPFLISEWRGDELECMCYKAL